jgi:hypothetical protein
VVRSAPIYCQHCRTGQDDKNYLLPSESDHDNHYDGLVSPHPSATSMHCARLVRCYDCGGEKMRAMSHGGRGAARIAGALLYSPRYAYGYPQEQQACASHKSFETERSILHYEWGHPQIGQIGQIGRLYHSVEDCSTAHGSGETPQLSRGENSQTWDAPTSVLFMNSHEQRRWTRFVSLNDNQT